MKTVPKLIIVHYTEVHGGVLNVFLASDSQRKGFQAVVGKKLPLVKPLKNETRNGTTR